MTVAWCDTETTGIEPIDSSPFEVAIIIYQDSAILSEKAWRFNPLDDEVKFHEGAYKVHGITEETIRSYPPASEIVPEIAKYLHFTLPKEKYIFAGYKCSFDYGHLAALFFRHGILMDDLFNGKLIDVFERVKRAQELKILPKTPNQKLETMTKALGILHSDAHSALADIKATRKLYEAIYAIERSKNENRRPK
jgi:DNA polymerase III epsilon subunit-like protein